VPIDFSIRLSDAAARRFHRRSLAPFGPDIRPVPVAGRDTGRAGDQGLRADGDPTLIGCAEYARVDRLAGALFELGVRPGAESCRAQ
jgi:hypothetical protein